MEIQLKQKNKICLIGYGYWGKIIHKNLTHLGYTDITIIDTVLENTDLLTDKFDLYFVITPFTTHYEILMQLSNYKNKKIWCEKPLIQKYSEAEILYEKMVSYNKCK